jgi:hypothetical protein
MVKRLFVRCKFKRLKQNKTACCVHFVHKEKVDPAEIKKLFLFIGLHTCDCSILLYELHKTVIVEREGLGHDERSEERILI